MQHEIEVERSPDDLWPWLTEADRMKLWMKGLLEITPVSEGEPGVGFRSTMKIQEGRKVSDYDEEITAWDPPRSLAVRVSGGAMPEGMVMSSAYVLEDVGGRTRITCTTTGTLKGLWKLMGPLMKLFAGRQMMAFLKTLKKLAEA